MVRDDPQLSAAKRAYRNASMEGNRQEEARWANLIGDIFKNRGEYVEALKWLRIDYDISMKYLPEKQLLPTCQSVGELLLRLENFKDALIYQKKHLELAKDTNDLVEQQRASTQLGRTYHEIFLSSDDDHYSVRNAKKYFKSAMRLAQTLKENPPSNKSSFLKEFIDAHNNIGMLEMDLDNLEEAHKILTKGLKICDEEEVIDDDDGRSRLHHNLGRVYMELRKWDKAREHIEKDIIICKRIGHFQGEAKGYINLGELHYRVQKYEEANLCYQKALDLAKSMEDEDALVSQIDENIVTVKKAVKVMAEMQKEEQNLKKLARNMATARGTPGERRCLLQQNASLDLLIEKSSMIFAWLKHREFAKRKKRIANELCDKEKLSDSFLVIGESYQKLRNFDKALKWYTKSWETYKSINNLEGQALAKINIGDVLDSDGNWAGALDAFEEGYRIAVQANLPSVQLSALENMHYSHMIRFDNLEEARRLQYLIDKLKQSGNEKHEGRNIAEDCCSETDTEGDDCFSNSRSDPSCSVKKGKSKSDRGEFKDDVPLISLLQSNKKLPKRNIAHVDEVLPTGASHKSSSTSTSNQQTVGRKRIRVVLSDDEGEMQDEVACSNFECGRLHKCPVEDVGATDEFKNRTDLASPASGFQDVSAIPSKCAISSSTPMILEESTSSYKLRTPNKHSAADLKLHTSEGAYGQYIAFKIENDLIQIEAAPCMVDDMLSIESLKVEVACLYYLQLPVDKRSRGLLPIIQHMRCGGKALESFEAIGTFKDTLGNGWVEVFVDGWVQKRLIKLYVDCCKELSETPNIKLLKKLYNLEVSEDEVMVSECDLQDISIMPLLNALHVHKTIAMLDLSHNMLGNGTMEKLQQVFISSGQKYGGLALDLHCNRFGPTTLFQICECPVLFARLEVLNISGNRLTDACGSYLSTILEKCKALYYLNIERCSITSRTVQKVADALDSQSVLAQLCLGHNNPISGNSIMNLMGKLSTLERFSELNLDGLKLSKTVVDSLCQLVKSSCLSGLMLGGSSIGTDGALQLTKSLFSGAQELVKLDLSYCGLTSEYITNLNAEVPMVGGILEINLGGNPVMQEGGSALASLLMNPHCCLKVLVLNNCQLGLAGVLQIIQALSENDSLEELNVAGNANLDRHCASQNNLKALESSETLPQILNISVSSPKVCVLKEVAAAQEGSCIMNTDYNQLEVADSEDDPITAEPAASYDDNCTSSCKRMLQFSESEFIQGLSTAIGMAKKLQLLDLSNNGFSTQDTETIYTAWSLGSRSGLAQRHIKGQTVHLFVRGQKCCGVKPCCKRD
ncbi:protein TONSOKU [Vitis riparia]|uniref:protein TONSOKU n=1 Tax=Vitis riparia TaxID=96939 RepID=UPI00155A1A2A|nr:protein TONSOKU [Vitis riparia]